MIRTRLFIALLCITFVFTGNVFAYDFSFGNEFKEGDIISADVFNEVFGYIEQSANVISAADLVGDWTCLNFVANDDLVRSGDTIDPQNFYAYKMISLTFTDDGDGTYSWSSYNYNPFNRLDDVNHLGGRSGSYTVLNNVFFANYDNNPGLPNVVCELSKVSPSRLLFRNAEHGGGPATTIWMVCDNQSIPPAKPTQLQATRSGFAIRLSWKDNSDNETGFVVFRRELGNNKWVEIGSVSSNMTVFDDTVTHKNRYWYRVKAENSFGSSDGSNVVKVEVD
jgi:hypothetical protein